MSIEDTPYGVLAALLAVPATALVIGAHPGTPRITEPARAPQACQERSGGDRHCPGG